MQICLKVTRKINKFLMGISAILIALATALATVNAFMRFFSSGVAWSEEMTSYCVVLLVYLAIPLLELTGDQLNITAIDLVVKGKTAQRVLNYIRGLVTGSAMVILAYYGFTVMSNAFMRSQVTYVLHIPKGILYGLTTGCLVLAVLAWLVIMIFNKGDFDEC